MMIHPLRQWQEEMERHRLANVYNGLRCEARPRYIFDGKDAEYYLRFHPQRRTVAVFPPLGSIRMKSGLLISGLKTLYRPIMGASPASYYVKNGGNDEADGLSDGNAWATIGRVNAGSFLASDYIGFKRGSTWTNEVLIPPGSGSGAGQIIFGDYGSGALPKITGPSGDHAIDFESRNYTTIQNMELVAHASGYMCVGLTTCHHIILDGLVCHDNAAWHLINIVGPPETTHDLVIQNCVCYNAVWSGIALHGTSPALSDGPVDVQILDNVVYDNGSDNAADHGIYIAGVEKGLIRGNVSYGNACSGIKINTCYDSIAERNLCYDNLIGIIPSGGENSTSSTGTIIRANLCRDNKHGIEEIAGAYQTGLKVLRNTIYNCYDGNGFWAYADGLTGMTFEGNCIVQPDTITSGFCVRLYDVGEVTDNTFDYNCYINRNEADLAYIAAGYTFAEWQALSGSPDAHSINSEPLFLAEGTDDFHLQSGSPCIDACPNMDDVPLDYDGIPTRRGTSGDIGAFETLKGGPRGL